MPFASLLADPNFVYMLMVLGCYGLIYELVSPGIMVPGISGAILLLLGFFAIGDIHVNYFGILLMLCGFGLMTAEAFVPMRGFLGLLGAIGFAGGSVLFLNETVSYWLIGSMMLVSALLLSLGLKALLRTRRATVSTGTEALKNSTCEIVNWSGVKGEVMAEGSVWQARSLQPQSFKKGDKAKVAEIDGLCIVIEHLQ